MPGTIVTVKGNWVQDPNVGNNELFYVTDICRTGNYPNPPSYTAADADMIRLQTTVRRHNKFNDTAERQEPRIINGPFEPSRT